MSVPKVQSIKLSEWAKLNGYSYGGALKMFHRGRIDNTRQLASGTILVEIGTAEAGSRDTNRAVLYSRVSTRKQEESLERQAERLEAYALGSGLKIVGDVREIASGMNENRSRLLGVLRDTEGFDVFSLSNTATGWLVSEPPGSKDGWSPRAEAWSTSTKPKNGETWNHSRMIW